jgi:hypothetical protein
MVTGGGWGRPAAANGGSPAGEDSVYGLAAAIMGHGQQLLLTDLVQHK